MNNKFYINPTTQGSCILIYNVEAGINAFSTIRNGLGVSSGNFGKMNINPYCGDNLDNVEKNRKMLADELGLSENSIILPQQTHGNNCKIITQDFLYLTPSLRENYLRNTDAIITNLRQICIGVSTADCVPILLYDKKNKVSAAVHSGWRGTVNRIIVCVINEMIEKFHSVPQDIIAIIGPSISKFAFEVGQEVYDIFKKNKFLMSSISEIIDDKWHIDLCLANKLELLENGLLESNIILSNICTYANSNLFFSARRLSFNCGRIYNGIIIA